MGERCWRSKSRCLTDRLCGGLTYIRLCECWLVDRLCRKLVVGEEGSPRPFRFSLIRSLSLSKASSLGFGAHSFLGRPPTAFFFEPASSFLAYSYCFLAGADCYSSMLFRELDLLLLKDEF